MKVFSLGVYDSNTRQQLKSQRLFRLKPFPVLTFTDVFVKTNSHKISFTSNVIPIKKFLQLDFKNKINFIPCPCCGIKMISRQVFKKINWLPEPKLNSTEAAMQLLRKIRKHMNPIEQDSYNLLIKLHRLFPDKSYDELLKLAKTESDKFLSIRYKKLTPSQYANKLFRILNHFESSMHPFEKNIFKHLKKLHQKHPDENFQQLFRKDFSNQAEQLRSKYFVIFNKIYMMRNRLPLESLPKLDNFLSKFNKALLAFDYEKIIKEANRLYEVLPEKNTAKYIIKLIKELPRPKNDINAFIIKYSDKTSKEIGQRLLMPSVSSIEHVRPKNPREGLPRGFNDATNYMLECSRCNNSRGNTPMHLWIKKHENMVNNTQKHINEVIKLINQGKIKGYEWYPQAISDSLAKESNGAIKLDTSSLKNNMVVDLEEVRRTLPEKIYLQVVNSGK